MMKKSKINIQLFADEDIKGVEDLEDEQNTEQQEDQKIDEKDEKIKSLEERVKFLEEREKKLLSKNNELYAKCLSYKENKQQPQISKTDTIIKNLK